MKQNNIKEVLYPANEVDKDKIVILLASGIGGYSGAGFKSEGYKVYTAYKNVSIVQRIIRELCFRLPFLPKTIWYSKDVLSENPRSIIVRDSLITNDYLQWLKKHFPKSQINFLYENMIGKSRHIYPQRLPSFVRPWTYDGYDARKYGLLLHDTPYYFKAYVKQEKKKKYDLLFVGEDKGRAEYVLRLQEYLNNNGFKMKVHIVAESRLDRKKEYYKERVSYNQITEWISESRAILNVALMNQEGVTVRDLESIFNHVKLVTTNNHIRETKLYREENVFVLRNDNWSELVDFLKTDYATTDINIDDYSPDNMVRVITGMCDE